MSVRAARQLLCNKNRGAVGESMEDVLEALNGEVNQPATIAEESYAEDFEDDAASEGGDSVTGWTRPPASEGAPRAAPRPRASARATHEAPGNLRGLGCSLRQALLCGAERVCRPLHRFCPFACGSWLTLPCGGHDTASHHWEP